MTDAPLSPDLLQGQPQRGPGVRRLNRVPLLIATLILSLIMGAVAYTYHLRLQTRHVGDVGPQSDATGGIGVLTNAPENGYIPPKVLELPQLPSVASPQASPTPVDTQNDPKRQAWENYYQKLERMRAFREQAALQAALANTPVNSEAHSHNMANANVNQNAAAPVSASEQFAALAAQRFKRLDELDERGRDLNRQADKRDFLAERQPKSREENTLQARREAPRTPYEVKAGTVIPATMIGGVNSDLPGQLLGQVSENVYDTATGRFILIPQGAKLVGTYDNGITPGQERVLVAWTRIIYPDASSLDLGKMPGADESGYAGFHDRVDNHYFKAFSSAILLSAFSAGIQLSQGNGNNQTGGGLNATQTIAASTGQQLGQLGQEIARRNLQIQPTLEIRPGYRFAVTVTKDLILRPWRPTAPASLISSAEVR